MPALVADDGCRIHYAVSGNGPPVVLVPGLGGDGRFWNGVVETLGDRYRLIAVDHRGAGRSDRPDGFYSIERIARDVIGILDREGVEKAHVVGHSTGGAIAQAIALDWSGRGLSFVVSGSWARPDARFRMLFQARLDLLDHGLTETYQRLTHVLGHCADYLAAHEAEMEQAVKAADARLQPLSVTMARIRMLLDFDRLDELSRIAAPVLVIGADDDEMVPLSHSRQIANAIAGARLAVMQGGHFYPSSRSDAFAALIDGFMKQVRP